MKTLPTDDMKIRIIDEMRKAQARASKDKWFSQSEIFEAVEGGFAAKKVALVQMTSEGWLHVRHAPDMPDRLFYRLRAEYQ